MTRPPRRFSFALLLLAFLSPLAIGSGGSASAAAPDGLPLWSPGDLDPTYPFSDRFPVAVVVKGEAAARAIATSGIDVESVTPSNAEWVVLANVNAKTEAELRAAGHEVYRLRNLAREEALAHPPGTRDPAAWPTWTELETEMQAVAAAHPNICRLVSIGTTVQGRNLWFMKITDNPDVDEDEPEFRYTSSIHGDEVTGMEMCRRMIHYLADNYGTDPTVTSYVDGIEIWICPMFNPDGFVAVTRYNAHSVDMNRDFPDPVTDPIDSPVGREPEVQAFMNFGYDHRFALSINYHGGALVLNYPWDCQEAYTPDDVMIKNICLGYAVLNPPMWNSTSFTHGVTIGWAWYIVYGGMQDWCYNWRSDIDVTAEISTTKWPAWSTMDQFWTENRDAMLYYIGRSTIGIRGIVTSGTTGMPLDATVDITQVGKTIRTDPDAGDYHRLLEPGTYSLQVSSPGYLTQTIPGIVVTSGAATRRDVVMQPLPSFAVSGTVTETTTGNPLSATIQALYYDTQSVADQTMTDPLTGAYSLTLQTYTYDLKVVSAGHVAQTRRIDLTSDRTENFVLDATSNRILVVQDGATTRMAADLTALGFSVTTETAAATDPAAWDDYKLLVWSSGANADPVADATKRAGIEAFIATGGRLLIEGGQTGYDTFRNPAYPTFGANVLHCSAWDVSNAGALSIAASGHVLVTTPNALPSTLSIQYTGSGDQDAVTPLANATLIYRTASYPNDGGVVAYDDTPATPDRGQVVFYSFNYDKLTDTTAARQLLENSVNYLNPANPASVAETGGSANLLIGSVFPNPARGLVQIELSTTDAGPAHVGVYDLQGRCVQSWVENPTRPGRSVVSWAGRTSEDRAVPSGIYFVRVRCGAREDSRPFLWIDP
jgi:hypothetical protein